MPLTILTVAYSLAPVAPGCAGGAEEIAREIDDGLSAAGHHSIVIAQEGSQVRGTLVPIPCVEGPLDERARQRGAELVRRALAYVLRQWPVNLIHFHGLDFPEYVPAAEAPMIATLHLPIGWYAPAALQTHS